MVKIFKGVFDGIVVEPTLKKNERKKHAKFV